MLYNIFFNEPTFEKNHICLTRILRLTSQSLPCYLANDILIDTPKLLLEVGNAVDDTRGVFT